MKQLACPICGDAGPWASAQDRMAHIRAHHTVTCEVCDEPVNASGLDAHMRYIHPDQPAAGEHPVAPPVPDDAPAPGPELVDDQAPAVDDVVQPAPDVQVADPPRVDDPDTSPGLSCDRCDAGPFASRRGLTAHRRSHETVTCEVCAKPVKANGLGPHMAAHRRAAAEPAPAEPPAAAPPPAPEAAAVADETSNHEEPAPRPTKVECEECGKRVPRSGLGSHRAAHRHAEAKAREAAAREAEERSLIEGARASRLAGALAELVPAGADELVDRLAAFVAQHKPESGTDRWIVATATSGPWLCRTGGVGLLAAREHVPCIVVSVDDVYACADRQASAEPRPTRADRRPEVLV